MTTTELLPALADRIDIKPAPQPRATTREVMLAEHDSRCRHFRDPRFLKVYVNRSGETVAECKACHRHTLLSEPKTGRCTHCSNRTMQLGFDLCRRCHDTRRRGLPLPTKDRRKSSHWLLDCVDCDKAFDVPNRRPRRPLCSACADSRLANAVAAARLAREKAAWRDRHQSATNA